MFNIRTLQLKLECIDAYLFSLINHTPLRNKPLDYLMLLFTHLGEGWVVILLCTIYRYVINPAASQWYQQAVVLIIATGVVCQIIKRYFVRKRPAGILPAVNVVGPILKIGSFPSGHTATSFALAVLFYHHGLGVCFFLLALCIGFSRSYVGAHFPLDVICGGIIGTFISIGFVRFLEISPRLGITNPLLAVCTLSIMLVLGMPFFMGYTFSMMARDFKNGYRDFNRQIASIFCRKNSD